MAEMEETDESYTYKMKIGITYKERIEAVVHPIDCVYDADSNAYHLRRMKVHWNQTMTLFKFCKIITHYTMMK